MYYCHHTSLHESTYFPAPLPKTVPAPHTPDTRDDSFLVSSNLPQSLVRLVSDILVFDCFGVKNPIYSAKVIKEDLEQMIEFADDFLSGKTSGVDHLSFVPNKFYGLSAELSALRDAFKRILCPDSIDDTSQQTRNKKNEPTEIIVLSGLSGCGKSLLLDHVKGWVRNRGGTVVSATFTEKFQNQPLVVLIDAFSDWCDTFSESDIERMRKDILDAFGSHIDFLLCIIPALQRVVGNDLRQRMNASQIQRGWMAYISIICKLIRSISSYDNPFMLALNNIPMADHASVELFKKLVTDEKIEGFLFVATYPKTSVPIINDGRRLSRSQMMNRRNLLRSTRSISVSSFAAFMTQITTHEMKGLISVTSINIQNPDRDLVNHLIADTLRQPRRLTEKLSNEVFRLTQGNLFFTKKILKSMKEDGLLYYDSNLHIWLWNEDIISNMNVSENVSDLISDGMKKLPHRAQVVLKSVSFIGFQFERSLLEMVCSGEKGALDKDLDLLVSGAFLNMLNEGAKYEFSHYEVYIAACSLLSLSESNSLQIFVAETMGKNPDRTEKDVLVAADLANQLSSIVTDKGKKIEIAKLNHLAGKQSLEKCDFNAANRYLIQSLHFLPENHW